MTTFDVQDMTCAHCVATISRAVQAADPSARVAVDLPAHRVSVEAASVPDDVLRRAIEDAGYTPVPVPAGG